MTPQIPGNWQASAKGIAATVLLVAIGLYLAVRLIEAVATVLIVLAAVGALAYIVVLFVRYRRSRW
jgi:hypothetical protein